MHQVALHIAYFAVNLRQRGFEFHESFRSVWEVRR
jgi:hypothetical protein